MFTVIDEDSDSPGILVGNVQYPINSKLLNDKRLPSITTGPYGGTIKIGEPVSMPRELCDPNPENHCSPSLHVGSMHYVKSFGGSNAVILECLVNPRNIVAVPSDMNCEKLRTCEYYPYAISNGENENVYLESDYLNYDKEQLKEELKAYEKKKLEYIEQLEAELELRKKITGLL